MALYVVAPERKGKYVVLEPVRFRGRNYTAGDVFDARRLDVPMQRLNVLYRDGLIGLPDADADAAERQRQADAIASHPIMIERLAAAGAQPDFSIEEEDEPEAEIESMPEEGDDFEE